MFVLISCNNNGENLNENINDTLGLVENNFATNYKSTKDKKNIRDFIVTDTSKYYRWNSSNDYFVPSIIFYKEYAVYWINGQCVFWFFTFEYSDSIKQFWSYKIDCVLDMDFLEKSYNCKKYPKHRDIFASYGLLNDTTIIANYVFQEWVDKVNLISDTIFPKYFYLYKDD